MSNKSLTCLQKGLKGSVQVPGDKSISHRAVMFGAIAEGKTEITGFLPGADCLSTIACFQKMGIDILQKGDKVTVYGKGWSGLNEPSEILDVGNSGTTTRLMLGILAGRPFHSVVIGDESIARRPMSRVTEPLRQMGAEIDGREDGTYTPLSIRGGETKGIHWVSKVASAQVKSCILLAGLQSEGKTTVEEPSLSRDHTERMLEAFGVEVTRDNMTVSVEGGQALKGRSVFVPGDISSAAFLLAAGAIVPDSEITIENVGVNPTRTGIVDVMKKMGVSFKEKNKRDVNGEPVADFVVKTSNMQGTTIEGDLIPRLIDEIPIIAVMASQAVGTTVIKDAEELKVKETNRIDTVVSQLKKMGADIEATPDGMIIRGSAQLQGAELDSFGDHRIGMAMSIAALIAKGESTILDTEAINVSYPTFYEHIDKLRGTEN
ncbi:3-phosphoshikimate 1-carboxyvinyltransferase [Thalassorhabdus alkalitolerans]|uniref:3-phosphoshikimate 1-carboxyvinyltransferase n=1 Tax=Thalassorhabdus alkalitolerans TaxID=2282697 RepID=A0ABW0YST0_9BACI